MLWGVGLVNGLLGWLHREEREAQIIYFEEEVGPNEMPTGLDRFRTVYSALCKLMLVTDVAAEALERSASLRNFDCPAVSLCWFALVWLLCTTIAGLLVLLPAHLVCFMLPIPVLLPLWLQAVVALCRPSKLARELRLPTKKPSVPMPAFLRALLKVLRRAPSGPEFAHHLFCKRQVVETGL